MPQSTPPAGEAKVDVEYSFLWQLGSANPRTNRTDDHVGFRLKRVIVVLAGTGIKSLLWKYTEFLINVKYKTH